MAAERASNDNVPVDALLAALRRAAEEDGVEDVDAVVAEFATFVRAHAPHLASAQVTRRSTPSWTTALLAAGALTTAAFGAVASGIAPNPFLGQGSRASAATADGQDADAPPASIDAVVAGAGATASGTGSPGVGDATAAPSITYSDPDFLAVVAEQRAEIPDQTLPTITTPTPVTTATTNGSATPAVDPATGATTTTSTTLPGSAATTATTGDTTADPAASTTVPAPTDPAGPAVVESPLESTSGISSTSGSSDPSSSGGAG